MKIHHSSSIIHQFIINQSSILHLSIPHIPSSSFPLKIGIPRSRGHETCAWLEETFRDCGGWGEKWKVNPLKKEVCWVLGTYVHMYIIVYLYTRWWFQPFFIFTPKIGEMILIWRAYFSGLKPPTRVLFYMPFWWLLRCVFFFLLGWMMVDVELVFV